MERYIYSSSNKIIGRCCFTENEIIIENKKKKPLIITDKDLLMVVGSREYNYEAIEKLWNDYTCTIGEIACIFDVLYYKANRWVKKDSGLNINKKGRRNASKDQKFTEIRLSKMSESNKGKTLYNNGVREISIRPGQDIPEGFVKGRLPFSEDLKEKLRNIIIQKKLSGEMLSPKEVARSGWKNGKFDRVDFKRGISGYIFSIKNQKKFFFRSLLELYYMIMLEEDPNILSYEYEPFRISCDNGSLYTPDLLINNTDVIELKSYKFIFSQGGEILQKFIYKTEQAQKYCDIHEYTFRVIYDKDVGFESQKFKNELKNNQSLIHKYNIEFIDPSRIFGHKK